MTRREGKDRPVPPTPKQIAERLYREHGPMPDHLLRKTAAILRDAQLKARAEQPDGRHTK